MSERSPSDVGSASRSLRDEAIEERDLLDRVALDSTEAALVELTGLDVSAAPEGVSSSSASTMSFFGPRVVAVGADGWSGVLSAATRTCGFTAPESLPFRDSTPVADFAVLASVFALESRG